jgi:hypothetical protein
MKYILGQRRIRRTQKIILKGKKDSKKEEQLMRKENNATLYKDDIAAEANPGY